MIAELQRLAKQDRLPWQNLLKEALQFAFLEVFFSHAASDAVVFQGGTALRLMYGGPRHSEDLDFVTTVDLKKWDDLVTHLSGPLARMNAAFEGELSLSPWKETSPGLRRWKLKWVTPLIREHVWVRIELARYPAYTRELLPLKRPMNMPPGPWVLVPTESREEILADKITAIAGRPYIKGRDFLDVWFLRSQSVQLDGQLLKRKWKDYAIKPGALERNLEKASVQAIAREMEVFLPWSVRRLLEKEDYRSVLDAAARVIGEAQKFVP